MQSQIDASEALLKNRIYELERELEKLRNKTRIEIEDLRDEANRDLKDSMFELYKKQRETEIKLENEIRNLQKKLERQIDKFKEDAKKKIEDQKFLAIQSEQSLNQFKNSYSEEQLEKFDYDKKFKVINSINCLEEIEIAPQASLATCNNLKLQFELLIAELNYNREVWQQALNHLKGLLDIYFKKLDEFLNSTIISSSLVYKVDLRYWNNEIFQEIDFKSKEFYKKYQNNDFIPLSEIQKDTLDVQQLLIKLNEINQDSKIKFKLSIERRKIAKIIIEVMKKNDFLFLDPNKTGFTGDLDASKYGKSSYFIDLKNINDNSVIIEVTNKNIWFNFDFLTLDKQLDFANQILNAAKKKYSSSLEIKNVKAEVRVQKEKKSKILGR